ncbi:MAG: gamma-glutamylcyclotransferase [Pseudomonadota bacterium]
MANRSFSEPFTELTTDQRRASQAQFMREAPSANEPLWLFAYGSLLWRPDFAPEHVKSVTLMHYERAFCVWTVQARGTLENPGLGLGLRPCRRGQTTGLALAIPARNRQAILSRLWAREMHTAVYEPRWITLTPRAGTTAITAFAFVASESHPQYAGHLTLAEQSAYIGSAVGRFGRCADYLHDTVKTLSAHGIDDQALAQLSAQVRAATPAD